MASVRTCLGRVLGQLLLPLASLHAIIGRPFPILLTSGVLAAPSAVRADSGFTGAFDFNNWIFSSGGSGASYAADANTITIQGSQNFDDLSTYTSLSTSVQGAYQITFNWSFVSNDPGGAQYDPAGYLKPDYVQLTDSSSLTQSGSASLTFAGGTFGFYALSDNYSVPSGDGYGRLTVTNFTFTPTVVTYPRWTGTSDGNWTTAANWTSGAVPAGQSAVAEFGVSTRTSGTVNTNIDIGSLQFNAGASAYTLTISNNANRSLNLYGNGIVNNSGTTQTINNRRTMRFYNSASAGNAVISNSGANASLTFAGLSSAGSATITNSTNASLLFAGTSSAGNANITISSFGSSFGESASAGNATITVNSSGNLNFMENSSAGNATFLANGGGLYFYHQSTGTGATVTLSNGTLDISSLTTSGMAIGEVSGSGSIYLGSKNLSVGAKNTSTSVSAVIQDGGFGGGAVGSLNKVGTGTLTLTGANTFTGTMTVSEGTLRATTSASALGAGVLRLAGGTLVLANNSALSFNRNTTVAGNATITSGRLANGAGLNFTLGTLSIGAQTLTLGQGPSVTSGAAGVTFGATTLTASGGTFSAGTGSRLALASVTGADYSFTVGGAGSTVVSGGISTGTGSLTKTGSGLLTISGSSSYSGGTRISSGTLSAGNNFALGTGQIVVDGGVFVVETGVTVANTVRLSGGVYHRTLTGSLAGAVDATSDLGEIDTTARILAGSVGATTTLITAFSAISGAINDGSRVSDVYSFAGTGNSVFVLELSFTSTAPDSYLGWLSGGQWVHAVDGNTGNNATAPMQGYDGTFAEFQAEFGTTLSGYIGAYGTDTTGGVTRTWAVINHNSDFAAVPEPSAWLLVACGAAFVLWRRHGSKA